MANGLVCYADFCNNIDTVFSDAVDPISVIENSKSTSNFNENEMETLLGILGAIRTEITNKRILIKP